MSSPAQNAANQANAALSTGPRTEAGKSRAAQNARRHGLTAAHLVIPESDRDSFDSMRDALTQQLAPQGELELTLFDTLLHANWNIRRCRIIEAGMMTPGVAAIDPLLLEQNEAKLRQLDRHARRHDASFHRALRELKALQTGREFRALALGPPLEQNEANPPEPSPLADLRAARQAYLREHAAKARINGANMDLAIHRIETGAPDAPISYFTFDRET